MLAAGKLLCSGMLNDEERFVALGKMKEEVIALLHDKTCRLGTTTLKQCLAEISEEIASLRPRQKPKP